MRRYQHRLSKDIDIFVPDPQALGFVTPRLSDAAGDISLEYTEAANFVKLLLKDGEIDFVASPNLTDSPYVLEEICGRQVRVETSAEIIAKKFWHRGGQLMARDIFDFCLVAEKEPTELMAASKFLVRHIDEINKLLDSETVRSSLKIQFDAIETLDYKPSFEVACETLRSHLQTSVRYLADADEEQSDNAPARMKMK